MPFNHRKPFPVAILAGGLATRLRPLTETMPKAMIPVNGEPFVAHQFRLLRERGIEKVVLCLGYQADSVRNYVGDGSGFGLEVTYSLDGPVLLGTGGAVKQALPHLGDCFFVLYGDSYLTCDYAAVQQHFQSSERPALMTVFQNSDAWDRSNVEFSGGKIVRYSKKDRSTSMRHIDYGLGIFRSSVFESLPAATPVDLADIYTALADQSQLEGFPVNERFFEVGSLAGIQELSAFLSRSRQERKRPVP